MKWLNFSHSRTGPNFLSKCKHLKNANEQIFLWLFFIFSHILMQCLNPTLEGVRYAKNFNIWNFQVDANFSTILSHWKEIYIQFFFLQNFLVAAKMGCDGWSSGEVTQMRQWVGEKALDVAVRKGGWVTVSYPSTLADLPPPHPTTPQPRNPHSSSSRNQQHNILYIYWQYGSNMWERFGQMRKRWRL